MKSTSWALLLALVLSGGACGDFTVPNYNGQSITDLQNGANAAGIGAAAVGLLALSRDFESSSLQSHTALTGTFGREGVELDPSNPQHPVDRLDQIGTGEQGYAGWAAGYRVIKQGNVILAALTTATGMTDAQKAGVRGFTRTMQAFAFNRLINVFDAAGMPIAVDIPTTDPPAPIATKAQVLTHIGQLLDQADTDLGSAGSTFSFNFPAGFVAPTTQGSGAAGSFNTPSTFRTFNRALRARNAVYQADYATALTALTASFLNTTASFRFGAYDSYSTGSGDRANPLFDPTCRLMFALPQLLTGAQTQLDGVTLDRRYVTKVRRIPSLGPPPAVTVVHGYSVHSCFTLYPTADSPVPMIRNEELILLRAEARWFTNDKLNALADIDLIRTTSGGLAATSLTIASPDNAFVDELLYNRLYSLMWEGGHRWVDARRFNRLGTLPRTPSAVTPTQGQLDRNRVFPYLHLPTDECLPRSNPAASCTAPAGL